MSTHYDFMLEAMYDGKWYNADYFIRKIDGTLKHLSLECLPSYYLGYLKDFRYNAGVLQFEQLAEGTQTYLLGNPEEVVEEYVRKETYYDVGSIRDLEFLLEAQVPMEYYVTPTQIKAFEVGKLENIEEFLTAHELLELPVDARGEYRLYRWYDDMRDYLRLSEMVNRAKEQLQCFNDAIPYQYGKYGYATDTRIVCRLC